MRPRCGLTFQNFPGRGPGPAQLCTQRVHNLGGRKYPCKPRNAVPGAFTEPRPKRHRKRLGNLSDPQLAIWNGSGEVSGAGRGPLQRVSITYL